MKVKLFLMLAWAYLKQIIHPHARDLLGTSKEHVILQGGIQLLTMGVSDAMDLPSFIYCPYIMATHGHYFRRWQWPTLARALHERAQASLEGVPMHNSIHRKCIDSSKSTWLGCCVHTFCATVSCCCSRVLPSVYLVVDLCVKRCLA